MSSVNLSWEADGSGLTYNIYRSTSPMNISNMPTPLATGITTKSYTDSAVTLGAVYYYRVGSVSSGSEKISAEKMCIADKDIYWSQVSSLLHLNGVDSSTSFIDKKSVTWTKSGNAKISINDYKFGGSSLYLDGINSYLIGDSGVLTFGTGNFTIEFWLKLLQYPSAYDGNLVGFGVSTTSGFSLVIGKTNGLVGIWDGSNYFGVSTAIPLNSWTHFALCRNGNEISAFINGTKYVLTSSYTKQISANSAVRLGGNYANNNENYLKCYMNDFRVTAGAARYTSNFTVPSMAFLDN